MAVRQLPTFTIFANGQKLTDYVGTSVSEVARLLRKHKPARRRRGRARAGQPRQAHHPRGRGVRG